ncbi:uncharacterized protein V1518DRAFT_389862 [Limtongia smithiae]|uniref:uncharacterized protein n=1 Tax=Limtongia smithiae TaxID=1125753 RepID=UPI0034CF21D4
MASYFGAPTVEQIHESPLYEVAATNWINSDTAFKQTVVSNLLMRLQKSDFAEADLAVLDYVQCLERYLWPHWTSEAKDDHTILVILLFLQKTRDRAVKWGVFAGDPDLFASLFERVLTITSTTSMSLKIRSYLINFVDWAFQYLEIPFVRQQCARLVSISIWNSLPSESSREKMINSESTLKKTWRAAARRFDGATDRQKIRLRLERAWLYSVAVDTIQLLNSKSTGADAALYAERVLELFIDILSQLPTRRFVGTLLREIGFSVVMKLTALYKREEHLLLRQLHESLEYYLYFPVNDFSGAVISAEELRLTTATEVLKFQKIALDHFKDKLLVLALSNYGSLCNRATLLENLEPLSDTELVSLCKCLSISTALGKDLFSTPTEFLRELVLNKFVLRPSLASRLDSLFSLPTESTLSSVVFEQAASFNADRPLSIPRMNLQYLTPSDFLHRAYELHRIEFYFEIRNDIEAIVRRLKPQSITKVQQEFQVQVKTNGSSRLAQRISAPAILDRAPPLVGETYSSRIQAEIYLQELDRAPNDIQREWDLLRRGDVVFLVTLESPNPRAISWHERTGIKLIRAAEIEEIYDHNNSPIRNGNTDDSNDVQQADVGRRKPLARRLARRRRISLNLDSAAYANDTDKMYESINFVFRRRQRENNFKPILDNMKDLARDVNDMLLPEWVADVFMGYGDPTAANYTNLATRPDKLDMNDTFINWDHLKKSFDKKVVCTDGGMEATLPPYVISETENEIKVSTYHRPSMGPFLTDSRKRNLIPYTPAQVQAIYSGTNPGLTVIAGPPGTGKTDVTAQIVSNLYHNGRENCTLLIAHSNQALNRLLEKLSALDFDERHVLRLGHGEERLKMQDGSFSQYGRVENLLSRRTILLAEVSRLGESFGAQGGPGDSCEKADAFYRIVVQALWRRFQESVADATAVEDIASAFPFSKYFENAPQPLFNAETHTLAEAREIAEGCFRHVRNIFSELEDIRPFELIKNRRDRTNYLMTKEARIIALTATYASMKCAEIVAAGLRYTSVIVEEAAQLTEIESFIPLVLQESGQSLERIVLIGDAEQNAPVVQNVALKVYANLQQSMFVRFLRLGVPHVALDAQGRARPEIAELYAWRYSTKLTNLPACIEDAEYVRANAGFKNTFQFVEVEDYNGFGETEPSPHFVQNLGEAEYAVAIYMYMRLLGYAAEQISILTMYTGQKALIENVISERCASSIVFGRPGAVATVDEYQGEQNDYVIISLVRTRRVGHLRDERRMTVALSRARLGLYVLGRREVLESTGETRGFLERLDAHRTTDDKLELAVGEMYPSSRAAGEVEEGKIVAMASVEHLGAFVYEMTERKMEQLREAGTLAVDTVTEVVPEEEDYEDMDEDEGEDEGEDDRESEVDADAQMQDAGIDVM